MKFRRPRDPGHETAELEDAGDWYADPFGHAARRWYDNVSGWSKRVEGAGQAPDKTGLARLDAAAVATPDAIRRMDADGHPVPLSRPVDPLYMANARPRRISTKETP
jgi:hypothetical protein